MLAALMANPSRIKAFFSAVIRSCYDMEWYRVVRTRPWTKALAYVVSFHLMITTAMTAAFAPGLFMAQTAFLAHVGNTFSQDARIDIAKGKLSTNFAEPFEAGVKGIRVTFDTSVTGTALPERYADHGGILVGRDAAFVQKSDTERRTYLMSEFPDVTMTRADVLGWVGTWGMLAVLAFLLLFALTVFALSVAGSLLYVAITAALASMIGTLWGVKISYGAWYAVGLHAVTLPTFVNLAANSFGLRIPFAYTFIYFMFLFAVIADERAQPAVAAEAPAERPPEPKPPAAPKPEPPPAAPRPRTRKIASAKPTAKPAVKRPSGRKPAAKK